MAAQFDLSADKAWGTLIGYADNDLHQLVFERDASIVGENPARLSKLLRYLDEDAVHRQIPLSADDRQRLVTWMDTYGHTQGAFSAEQERELEAFRQRMAHLLE